jgi:LacI family transcriptional regulator
MDLDIGTGVEQAIHHLYGLGHRAIGFVTVAPVLQEKEYGYATWALKGYEQTCRQLGIVCLWRAVDLKSDNIEHVTLGFFEENPGITAIVTPQGGGVPGVWRVAQARGLRIPEDISVVGLTDPSLGEYTTPPLTAITFPAREMGYGAAEILIAHLEGSTDTVQQVLLSPELLIRGTTGPARGTS